MLLVFILEKIYILSDLRVGIQSRPSQGIINIIIIYLIKH